VIEAITRADVADYLSALINVYTILILAEILLSWIPRLPYNPALRWVVQFVHDVTEPYLSIFRRLIPPIGIGGGGLDLSPIAALLVLQLVGGIVVRAVAG
jgi:uncharacterized protein YggT (Ycf19 family)